LSSNTACRTPRGSTTPAGQKQSSVAERV
jgi:hypothetical protein